jgi:hypothetical protein
VNSRVTHTHEYHLLPHLDCHTCDDPGHSEYVIWARITFPHTNRPNPEPVELGCGCMFYLVPLDRATDAEDRGDW